MEYLAQFKIEAYEVGFGAPLPYEDRKDWPFVAGDNDEAVKIAQDQATLIKRSLIGATVTLDKLLKVEEVPLK